LKRAVPRATGCSYKYLIFIAADITNLIIAADITLGWKLMVFDSTGDVSFDDMHGGFMILATSIDSNEPFARLQWNYQ